MTAQHGAPRRIAHVDLDAFYASVEQRDDPRLRGKPVIVGGLGARGVVATASYEARAFGVHSALPMSVARRRCPQGVFLAPRFETYKAISAGVRSIFERYANLIEPVSLDEAYLDITGADPAMVAAGIRSDIRDEFDLAASVGIGSNKTIAKLASDDAKPDGVLIVADGQELAYLHPKAVERLNGVGPATATKLHAAGITTIGELADVDRTELTARFGVAVGTMLAERAAGIDERAVIGTRDAKSISAEDTFDSDITDLRRISTETDRLAARVAERAGRAGLAGRTITVKVRYRDFRTITRSHSLDAPTCEARTIGEIAWGLVRNLDLTGGVRLLGVGVSNLTGVAQLSFDFDTPDRAADTPSEAGPDDGDNATAVVRHPSLGEVAVTGQTGDWVRVEIRQGPLAGWQVQVDGSSLRDPTEGPRQRGGEAGGG